MYGRRVSFRPGREVLWTGALFALFLFALLLQPIRSADFWWHLKVGEIVLEERTVPRVDRFSSIMAGQPYIYQSWLAGVCFALLFRWGGAGAVVVAHAGLLVAAYALLWASCRKGSGHPLVATACTFVAMVVCGGNWGIRPQSFSTFFFALFFWLLVRHGVGERVPFWAFPLGMLFWANLHGAFVLGLGLLGAALVGEIVAGFWPGRPFAVVPVRRLAGLAVAFAASVAATLVNPVGPRIYAYLGTIQRNPVIHRAIAEWQPPRVDSPVGGAFYASLFGLFFSLLYFGHRPHPRAALWLLGTGCLALGGVRSILWYTFPMALLGAEATRGLRLRPPAPPTKIQALANSLFLALCVGLVLLALPPLKAHLPLPPDLRYVVAPDTPVRAADYIQRHALSGPIFHRMEYGDYLLWRFYPQRRVFVDPRIELYSPELWEGYQRISQGGTEAGALLERYGIQVLLLDVERQAGLLAWARASGVWQLCYWDENEGTAVLARVCPAGETQ